MARGDRANQERSTLKSGSSSRVLDVFISTTAADLSSYRDAVHDALMDTGLFFCTSQKNMVAHDTEAEAFCRKKASVADLFIGLVGFRRGWEPAGDNAKRSLTEIEHDVAKESGRRRYIWVAPDTFLVPAALHESRTLYARQLAFRKRVMASGERIVSQKGFDSPERLAAAIVTHLLKEVVSSDLITWLRPEFSRPDRGSAEEQKPAIIAAIGQLAEDQDVDLLALAKNPKDTDISQLEQKLIARAEEHESAGRSRLKSGAEYWRHVGALAFLRNTQKALAAYEKAVALDPREPAGWHQLGQLLSRTGDMAGAEKAFGKMLELGTESDDKAVEADACRRLGRVRKTLGDLNVAEDFYRRSIRLNSAANRNAAVADAQMMLGTIFEVRGNLEEANTLYTGALTQQEKLGNREGIADVYLCLGNIARMKNDLEAAEENYQRCLSTSRTIDDAERMAAAYVSLALVHQMRDDFANAGEFYLKALKLHEEVGRKEGMAITYGNLGALHQSRGDLAKAEEFYLKALKLDEELGRKEGMAANCANLGALHQSRGDFAGAEELYRKALTLNEDLGSKEGMAIVWSNLGIIYMHDKTRMCHAWQKARDLWREMGLTDKAAEVEQWMKENGCP